MNPENAIEVRNVTKYFKVYTDKGHMLRERIVHIGRNKYEKKEVLKDISFDIKKGEAVGLIGKNGCGKSTTLKMLTKILRPSSGTIEENGRVSSLIELGAGFHQDLTGRENIYINASIFGFSRKEVDQRIDDIIEFSELEDFIDNPVRTYSSGMYMRLAFSVAINVDADILLIDEILAVGDVNFQTKCFEKLKEIKAQGTTIVIVSHSMGQIEMICDKCIWIEDGHIKEEGPAKAVDKHYLEEMEEDRLAELDKQYQKKINNIEDIDKVIVDDIELPKLCLDIAKPKGNYKIKITDLHMFNQTGKETQIYNTGDVILTDVYRNLTPAEQENFASALITLSFNPNVVILDTTSDIMDSATLIDAKNNPQKYPGLIVRVWGFSAYFNDLPEKYKDVLIERALQSEKVA